MLEKCQMFWSIWFCQLWLYGSALWQQSRYKRAAQFWAVKSPVLILMCTKECQPWRPTWVCWQNAAFLCVIVISDFIINIYRTLIESSAGYLLCRGARPCFNGILRRGNCVNVNLQTDWRHGLIFIPGLFQNLFKRWTSRSLLLPQWWLTDGHESITHTHTHIYYVDMWALGRDEMKILKGGCLTEPGPRGNYLFSFFVWEKCTAAVLYSVIVSGQFCEGTRVAFDLFSFYLLLLESHLYNCHIWDLCTWNIHLMRFL